MELNHLCLVKPTWNTLTSKPHKKLRDGLGEEYKNVLT